MRIKLSDSRAVFTATLSSIVFVCLARPAPAEATRPLIRVAPVIRSLSMSIPSKLEDALSSEKLGLDVEDAAARKLLMKQAADYVEYRRGRLSSAQEQSWQNQCDAKPVGASDENPFCRYERERKPRVETTQLAAFKREERRSIAQDLLDAKFEKVASRAGADVISAVSSIESSGKLDELIEKLAARKECVAPTITSSLAYKLEERFPAETAVASSAKLYRRSLECGGKDAATAQAAMRLGLIQIWQKKCDEVPELMARVETNPEGSQFHARAKYWRFYCAGETGNDAAKLVARTTLIHDHPMSFQTLAVSGDDEAAMAQVIGQATPQIAWRSIVRPDVNPMIRAAEALVKSDEPAMAAELIDRNVREIGTMETEVRLYLAVILNRIGYALPKFKILSELFQDDPRAVSAVTLKMYFPLWYYDVVSSKQIKVDPLLVLSLIRQESAFNKAARSIAGARGLMQVMPGTARMVASVRAAKLFDPSTNIGVGTKYLVKRLQQYGGDVELTLAAYNAGSGRVDQWKKRYPTDNKMLFLDFIPFRETREYVSAILRNYYWYVKLYSDSDAVVKELAVREKTRLPASLQPPSADIKVLAIMKANAGAAAATDLISVVNK